MTMQKDVGEIKVEVAKISQHLKDMNGKLIDCNTHRNTRCPDHRKDIYDKIDHIKTTGIKNTAILTIVMTLVMFLMHKFL